MLNVELDRVLSVWVHNLSPLTIKYYKRHLLRCDDWLQGRGQSVFTARTEDLVHYLETAPLSSRMKEQAKLVLRSFYGFCSDSGYISHNPARIIRLVTNRGALGEERITPPDAVRLICLANNRVSTNRFIQERSRFVCELAFYLGARRAEIAGIRLADFIKTPHGVQVQLFGKRSKRRFVLLPAAFAEQLLQWALAHRHEFLFPTLWGNPLSASGVALTVKRAAVLAGYPRFSTHWFRHAHATESIDNGCPLNVLQATLGHANVATTSEYLHARPYTSSALYLSLIKKEVTFLAERKPAHEVSERGPGSRQSRGGAGAEVHQLGQGRRKV